MNKKTKDQSTQIVLRPHTTDDADDVVRWRSDPDVVGLLFSSHSPTREEHLRWLEKIDETRREFIVALKEPIRAVGTASLSGISPAHGHAELGIMIGEKDLWGQGVGRAATELLLFLAFNEFALHRVFLRLFPENERALRLYERIGFAREGILREHISKNGKFRDVVVMGILEPAWRSARFHS